MIGMKFSKEEVTVRLFVVTIKMFSALVFDTVRFAYLLKRRKFRSLSDGAAIVSKGAGNTIVKWIEERKKLIVYVEKL
jgi:hypothetical protein